MIHMRLVKSRRLIIDKGWFYNNRKSIGGFYNDLGGGVSQLLPDNWRTL